MSGRYLLDTNILVALLAGKSSVTDRRDQAVDTYLSTITIGELYFGAFKSARIDENVDRIDKFVADGTILVPDEETSRDYGEIKANLRKKGKPIPENDLWIAALARHHNLILATRDKHFNEVEDLKVEKW